jgi:hypothetical protein
LSINSEWLTEKFASLQVKVQTKEVTEPIEQESGDDDGSDVSSETDEVRHG